MCIVASTGRSTYHRPGANEPKMYTLIHAIDTQAFKPTYIAAYMYAISVTASSFLFLYIWISSSSFGGAGLKPEKDADIKAMR